MTASIRSRQDLIEHVRWRLDAGPNDDLEPLVVGVLRALAECFDDESRLALEAAIAQAGGNTAELENIHTAVGAPLGDRVCALTGLSADRARELTQAVCYALTEEAPVDLEEWLVAQAPAELKPMFIKTEVPPPDPELLAHAEEPGVVPAPGQMSRWRPPSEVAGNDTAYHSADVEEETDDAELASKYDAVPWRESATVRVGRPISEHPFDEDDVVNGDSWRGR
jgi:hypothetical protein